MTAPVNFTGGDPLLKYLKPYKRTKEDIDAGTELTHTWFTPPAVSTYNIPADKYEELYDLVHKRAFIDKAPVHLVERFTNPSILKIDLDFEFVKETTERKYDDSVIKQIVKAYHKIIYETLDIDTDKIVAYIFTRTKGYHDKGKYKDGFHIMYPEIYLTTDLQKFIRWKFLNVCGNIFSNLGLVNRNYDLVVDESIIERNGWMMYGTQKVNRLPYLLTSVYNYQMDSEPIDDLINDNRYLIEYLSLYNKNKIQAMAKDEMLSLIDKFLNPPETKVVNLGGNKSTKSKIPIKKRRTTYKNSTEDLDTIKGLVALLDPARAHDHKSWIEVGLCLYNIDDSLLDVWIDFSKRAPEKFQEGECEKKWMDFHRRQERSLGLGSLHYWAMLDDKSGYELVKRNSLTQYLEISMNGSSYAIGKVVYEMYKYNYVCTSLRHNTWYEFRGHRWHEIDSGSGLKQKLSHEVVNEYLAMSTMYLNKSMTIMDGGKEPFISNAKKIFEVTNKLQDMGFKDKVMKECALLFLDNKFVEKLDTKWNLICFENGVYDLEKGELRDGVPEDFVSLTTGTDCIVFDEYMKEPERIEIEQRIKEVHTFMTQVFPIPRVREYVLTLLASFLQGKNPDEKFHVWTGSGSNGKSKTIELFAKAIGEYAGSLPVSLLTQKERASGTASPEVAKCRGKRFVDMAEPDRGQRMNIGLMKIFTGGDKIQARPLYKEPFEFKPQFKIVLCCNDLPKVPADDEGSWRRIRVVNFIAKFTKNPKKDNEFPIDENLADKFEHWKEPLMYILLQYYKKYAEEGLDEPPEVTEATRNYQKMADLYIEFLDEHIVTSTGTDDYISLDSMFLKFKNWYTSNYNTKPPNRSEFKMHMEKKLGRYPERGWKNMRFRTHGVDVKYHTKQANAEGEDDNHIEDDNQTEHDNQSYNDSNNDNHDNHSGKGQKGQPQDDDTEISEYGKNDKPTSPVKSKLGKKLNTIKLTNKAVVSTMTDMISENDNEIPKAKSKPKSSSSLAEQKQSQSKPEPQIKVSPLTILSPMSKSTKLTIGKRRQDV